LPEPSIQVTAPIRSPGTFEADGNPSDPYIPVTPPVSLPLIQVHSPLPEELGITVMFTGIDEPPPGGEFVTTTG